MEIIGVHECKVDVKGRVMLPAAIQGQLSDVLSEGFIIKRSIFQPCIELHPRRVWDESLKKVNTLNRFVKKNNDFIRNFMAGVREVEADATGRIQIPRDLAVFAGISKEVVVASAINIIEIWDKEKYEASIAANIDNFSLLAEEVMGKMQDE